MWPLRLLQCRPPTVCVCVCLCMCANRLTSDSRPDSKSLYCSIHSDALSLGCFSSALFVLLEISHRVHWNIALLDTCVNCVPLQPQNKSEWKIKKVWSSWNTMTCHDIAWTAAVYSCDCRRCFWHSDKSSNHGIVRRRHFWTKLQTASPPDGFCCSLSSLFPLNFPGESWLHVIVRSPLCDEPVTCQLGSAQHKRINDLCAGFKSNGAESCSIFRIAFSFTHLFLPAIISINMF